jgi:hypothetical protein
MARALNRCRVSGVWCLAKAELRSLTPDTYFVLQCKQPCSAARAKRALRGGRGPVSGEFGDLSSPAPFNFSISC